MPEPKKVDLYTFEILTMVEEGCSIRRIAQQFHLSMKTVMDVVEQFQD